MSAFSAATLRIARAPLAAFAAMGVVWGAYMAAVPDSMAMLGAGEAEFGRLMLATPLAAVAAMLLAPVLLPRLGRAPMAVVTAAMAAAFLVPGQMATPLAFALAMVACGFSTGLLDVTMTARVSALEAAHGLHLMSLNHAAYSLAYGLAAIGTGLLRSAGATPGTVLLCAGGLGLGLALLAVEREGAVQGLRRAQGGARVGRLALWGGLLVMLAFMAENAAEAWSALHIEQTLGGAKSLGSLGPAVMALTMAAGRIAGQGLAARLSPGRVLVGGALVAALGLALTGLAPSVPLAYAGLVVAGLGASVLAPTGFSLIGARASEELRTRTIARATALGYMGYFVGPPLLGMTAEVLGLRAAFVGMGLLMLAVPLLTVRVQRHG